LPLILMIIFLAVKNRGFADDDNQHCDPDPEL
jgi:hypothetical protein